jgi:hypothetical protein
MSCKALNCLEVKFARWEDQLKENYSSLGLKKKEEGEKKRKAMNQCS